MRPGPIRRLFQITMICLSAHAVSAAEAPKRPNILWITCEDISPNLGCYGDTYAVTPNLDRLASEGVRYTRAFAPIGVCAPSRSSLILGMYACSIGSQHMRCQVALPESVRCFPEYLRRAGYYCTNNVKTDYNFKAPATTWDQSSKTAHWRKRAPGQPFFAVFNFTSTHESQIRLPEDTYRTRVRNFTAAEKHDPQRAPLPPYHPDTPEARQDWARYADMITFMDKEAARVLAELEADQLADETIVFYYSDHGAGMPRSKRWLYESSTRVPLIIRFPKSLRELAPGPPGSTSDRLVSLVDFGPTVLSLAGIAIPTEMQGQAFLGESATTPRRYVHGFRDRMDERTDMLRTVRDAKYRYIRNFHPELPWFRDQHLAYQYEMPTMRVWQRLADEGMLTGAQAVFMTATKPTEELYDTEADPWEVNNLAGRDELRDVLERFRGELRRWQIEIQDLGFLPEPDLRTRFGDASPYDTVRREPKRYPLDRIARAADLANRLDGKERSADLAALLKDADPAVRYWGTVGFGWTDHPGNRDDFPPRALLNDPVESVRVAAADATCRACGVAPDCLATLATALKDSKNEWGRLQALQVLDRLGTAARPFAELILAAEQDSNDYVKRVANHAAAKLEP